jgi:hypothetical protein
MEIIDSKVGLFIVFCTFFVGFSDKTGDEMAWSKSKRASFLTLAQSGHSSQAIFDSQQIKAVSLKDMDTEFQNLIKSKSIKAPIAPGMPLRGSNTNCIIL